jgi:hypothetical protein
MTKDEALDLALEALEAALSDDQPYINKSKAAITAIKQALAAPTVQEPKFWYDEEEGLLHDHFDDAPLGCIPLYTTPPAQPAPVQEPDYAWPTVDDYEKDVGFQVGEAFKMAWNMARTTNGFLKLLSGEATPPAAKRQWVGLTLADREKLRDQFEGWNYPAILVDAVADILKEKNT